jgi:glycosyltransferase involved in cell wall biosynthesis
MLGLLRISSLFLRVFLVLTIQGVVSCKVQASDFWSIFQTKLIPGFVQRYFKNNQGNNPSQKWQAFLAPLLPEVSQQGKKLIIIIQRWPVLSKGGEVTQGGAQRYDLTLGKGLKEWGYQPLLIQRSGRHFWYRKNFQGLPIINIPSHEDLVACAYDGTLKPALRIYSGFPSPHPDYRKGRSIAISHCLMESMQCIEAYEKLSFSDLAAHPQLWALVLVDAATYSYLWEKRQHAFKDTRLLWIPSFVNTRLFYPARRPDDGKVKILFPHTVSSRKGFGLMERVVPRLLNRFPEVSFIFAGGGAQHGENVIRTWQKQYPGRVERCCVAFDQMPALYREVDIMVQPSLFSEGTSLSLLEALASGLPTAVSNLGGLTNIVINNHNGLLFSPTEKGLEDVLVRLIQNPDLRKRLGKEGRKIACQSFSHKRWKIAWKTLLNEATA